MRRTTLLTAVMLTACGPGLAVPDAAIGDAAFDAGPSEGDAALDGGAVDAGSPCSDPPGSACNPIVIDSLPFRHDADTTIATEDRIDLYACAPSTAEQGGEVHYELRLAIPLMVSFALAEASGVDVDVHVLRSADPASCIARANTTLEQALGAGRWRVVVDTYGTDGSNGGAYALTIDGTEPTARSLGAMWNTFYYLAEEADHEGPQDTPIYDAACNPMGLVRQAFHDSVCIEGTGRLTDGTLINVDGACTTSCPAARTCGSRSYRICYMVLDPERYPWGMGAGSRALEVDRSIAVDPAFVALGSSVYLEELDGLVPPGASEPHDGCMRADDVGGGVTGNQFDFFSGTRTRWLAWERILPTRSTLNAWVDDPRCFPRP